MSAVGSPMRKARRRWSLASLTVLFVLPSPVVAQFADPGTGELLGFSGAAHLSGDRYVIVVDTKDFQPERRLALLGIGADDVTFQTLPAIDWKDTRAKASDLEGVCAVPGKPGEFLLTESGSWQGRPGRMFRVSISGDAATVQAHVDLPLMADNNLNTVGDQYEGLECAAAGEDRVLVLLGERGGSPAYPHGHIRWAHYDLSTNTLTWTDAGRTGVEVVAPGQWLRPSHRHVSALYLDDGGTLWASATDDGGDTGPFRSIIYAAAVVSPTSAVPVRRNEAPSVAWEVSGSKIEGLALPPTVWRYAVMLSVSEDEHLGGSVQGLEAVLPGR